MFGKKVRGGALQLTLFIAVIIALLLFGFIAFMHLQKRFDLQNNLISETINNSNKGIQFALSNKVKLTEQSDSLLIFDETDKSLSLKKTYWGLYEKITSSSVIKNFTFQKVALLGGVSSVKKNLSLQMENFNKPLILVGNTKIQGNVIISKQGVKPGYIGGVSYYGNRLIYGNIKNGNKLPKFSNEQLDEWESIFKLNTKGDIDFIDIDTQRHHKNTFCAKEKIVFSNGIIKLEDVNLTGNIKVISNTQIEIDASSKLKDVIIIAPVVKVNSGTKGNFQVFANQKIEIEEGVQLNYPSALVLLNRKENEKNEGSSSLIIGENSKIMGNILFYTNQSINGNDSQVLLKKKSQVIGEVYCNQNLELQSSVYGTVYASKFIAKQHGGIYLNHIYDGKILFDKLPTNYVGFSFNKDDKKEVVKWLY